MATAAVVDEPCSHLRNLSSSWLVAVSISNRIRDSPNYWIFIFLVSCFADEAHAKWRWSPIYRRSNVENQTVTDSCRRWQLIIRGGIKHGKEFVLNESCKWSLRPFKEVQLIQLLLNGELLNVILSDWTLIAQTGRE